MNNEMIKYLLFLLNSEDLKKQSNRIIAEVGHNGNVQLLEDILDLIQQLFVLNKTNFPIFEKLIADRLKTVASISDLKVVLEPIVDSLKPQNAILKQLLENETSFQTIMNKQDEILTKMSNLEARMISVENLEKLDILIDLLGGVKGKAAVVQPNKVK